MCWRANCLLDQTTMNSSLTVWERLLTLSQVLADTPMLAIALTILAFFAANSVYIAIGRPVWLPPVVPAATILAGMIALLGLDPDSYREGANWLMLLLGPATAVSYTHLTLPTIL